MARLADLAPGMVVTVVRGYSARPAVVVNLTDAGTVHVRFTDVTPAEAATVPASHRGRLFGAFVRPSQIRKGN